jgi:hypothetical protein
MITFALFWAACSFIAMGGASVTGAYLKPPKKPTATSIVITTMLGPIVVLICFGMLAVALAEKKISE